MKEALFWEKKDDGVKVQCHLCPQRCVIADGRPGFCRVRKNEAGTLYTINYGRVSSYGMDPIEKKPLYHFYPGSYIFSAGTVGCNLRCGFCQNWQIAHKDAETIYISPERLVELAGEEHHGVRSIGIAYTYSEPLMWYEYVLETAQMSRQAGLKNVLVTNGFVNEEPLLKLLPYIDAMNIDVKGFSDEYYNKTCVGELHPVLETVERVYQKCHVEITTLLVPGLNDSPEEIEGLVDWLARLDKNIPLHFSRYFPNYKMDIEPTPLSTMELAREIAGRKLNYVYLGNVPGLDAANTYCPQCKALIFDRGGYRTRVVGLEGHKCRECGEEIKFAGKEG
ncbi:MAG: AmmeMemoRadiSam system radical SAM enzyme [Bacillota bacterium]